MKMTVFWDVAPRSLVEIDERFRGDCCLHHQQMIDLMMKAASTSVVLGSVKVMLLASSLMVRGSNPAESDGFQGRQKSVACR
jgi:hypothetical protein